MTEQANTRLIVVIVRGAVCNNLSPALVEAGYHVTQFSSIGGFLRHKNTTLMIGVPEAQVPDVLDLIRSTCPTPEGETEHTATIFVLRAGQFVLV